MGTVVQTDIIREAANLTSDRIALSVARARNLKSHSRQWETPYSVGKGFSIFGFTT
jgi:hypothetical protein